MWFVENMEAGIMWLGSCALSLHSPPPPTRLGLVSRKVACVSAH